MKRLTNEEFIIQVEEIHPLHDFSTTNYEGVRVKVEYKCLKHGIRKAWPNGLLRGESCLLCGVKSRTKKRASTLEYFLNRCKTVHNDKYNYEEVKYINGTTKVKIKCNNCKCEFEQSPNSHLGGQGCPKCSREKRSKFATKSTNKFIYEAIKVHGDKYSYDKVDYKKAIEKVVIHCNICNIDFEQQPNNHLKGQGCNRCARKRIENFCKENPIGWSKSSWEKAAKRSKHFDSYKVYILECWNDEEHFYKIGRTFRKIKERFVGNKNMPYQYKIFKEIKFSNYIEAYDYEVILKRLNKKLKYIPNIKFPGQEECFKKLYEDII